jgi:hypothetical protein
MIMKKIELLIHEFENLNTEEQSEVVGGFVSASLEDKEKDHDADTNYFQCGCNNYCPPKKGKMI